MSASDPTSAIFVTDAAKQIKSKINKHAFSGWCARKDDHMREGATLDVDVSWNYLTLFMKDDARLACIGRLYASGQMLTGKVKAKLIRVLLFWHAVIRRLTSQTPGKLSFNGDVSATPILCVGNAAPDLWP